MAHHGLADSAHVLDAGGSAREGAAAAMRLLDAGTLPTAIVAYNDRVACGIIDVLWRHRVRVPQDVSVVGFDNIPEAGMPHMDITTVEQRPEGLVSAVTDQILRRLGGEPAAGLHLMPPGPLVVRSSSGPPRLRVAVG
jgi:DNA-binding LacI/PurR family transcriptional regulator